MNERKPVYTYKVFSYRNHRYKVSHHEPYTPEMSGFTYYVYLNVDPTKTIKEVEDACHVGEFHGGITYCHHVKHRTHDNPVEPWQHGYEFYEVGCDYAHYGDENRGYTENEICFDAENTIDKLIEAGLLPDKEKKKEVTP